MVIGLVLGAASAGGAARAPCGPDAAHDLAADSQARVYVTSAGVYGCARRGGVPMRLGGPVASCLAGDRIGPVSLAGTTAAFASERCGIDTGVTRVGVRGLSDRRRRGR